MVYSKAGLTRVRCPALRILFVFPFFCLFSFPFAPDSGRNLGKKRLSMGDGDEINSDCDKNLVRICSTDPDRNPEGRIETKK